MIDWILRKFQREPDQAEIVYHAYISTFNTPQGQIVLQHLVNNVYATICYSNDPIEQSAHNGRRSVVQEIIETIHLKETHGRSEFTAESQ